MENNARHSAPDWTSARFKDPVNGPYPPPARPMPRTPMALWVWGAALCSLAVVALIVAVAVQMAN